MSTRPPFTIEDVLKAVSGRLIHGNAEAVFDNYCIDSRYVDDRSLFVPLMGQSRDGHQFVIDAIGKGAAAALVRAGHHQIHEIIGWLEGRTRRGGHGARHEACVIEVRHTLVALQKLAEWFRLQFDAKVLGVTGSVGKTGTKEMLIQLLSSKYPTVGTEKNFNNEIGVPLAISKITPKTRVAVVEMAMRARGEISLLSRIAHPDLAVITNTLGSHVGRLGSFEEVYKAKCEVVVGMNSPAVIALNRRDPNLPKVIEELGARREGPTELSYVFFDASAVFENSGLPPYFTPGISDGAPVGLPPADVWIEDVEVRGLEGSEFTLCTSQGRERVTLNLLGRGAVENLVAAAATALQLDMTLEEVAAEAPNLLPAPQRLNLFQLNDNVFLIDDCYNSSPASLFDSLELLLAVDPRFAKVAVLGDMLELGKFETLLHRRCAQAALNIPLSAVFAVGPRMNAVNEVEGDDSVELYYIEGHSGLGGFGGGRLQSHFGDPDGQARDRRGGNTVILEDGAASKLSSMLLERFRDGGEPTVLLIKGSRALHLERVVNDLLSATS